MPDQIILFRFDRQYDVCAQNLGLLKTLNPDIPVYGLYGGEDDLSDLPESLRSMFAGCWKIPLDDPYYKWRNSDLCIRMWFRDVGQTIDFGHLFLAEWDMVYTRPLLKLYPEIKENTNYGSLWGSFAEAKQGGWSWANGFVEKEIERLNDFLSARSITIDYDRINVSSMAGAVFCRKFIEQYCAQPVPGYSNDELRLSIYSQIFGIPLLDNGFHKNNNSRIIVKTKFEESEIINDVDDVLKHGGDVIHPVRRIIPDLKERIIRLNT